MGRPTVRATFEGKVYLWFTALFAASALALGENLVLLMGCLAFGCGQAARLLARRNVTGLTVQRSAPRRARVGRRVPATYSIANPRRRSAVGLRILERTMWAVRPRTIQIDVDGLAGRVVARKSTPLLFKTRGLHALGGLTLSSRFPLGFFRAETRFGADARVLVRPMEGRPSTALRRRLRGLSLARTRPSLVVTGDDVLHGVQEYREGNDPRRIHWRTSARRGALTVTEWRQETGREIVVLVGRSHGAGPSARAIFERAVSAAATVWRMANRDGLRARMVLGGGRRSRRIEGRVGNLGGGLDALAVVAPQGGRRPRAALRRLGRSVEPRIVVYVATGPEPGIERRLRAAAGRGGDFLLLRADQPALQRYVGGLA